LRVTFPIRSHPARRWEKLINLSEFPAPPQSDAGPLNREILALPELYVDSFRTDVPGLMRPVFNMLWNAFGFQHCEMYDGQGVWKGK
jgi:hypothetical protein